MRSLPASLLLSLLLAVAAVPAAPAVPVRAADVEGCGDQAEPNITVSEDANGINIACLIGGDGPGTTTPPVNTKPVPWCSAGYGTWAYPRYASPTTGEVIVHPGTTATSSGGKAGGAGFDAVYNQARIRAIKGLRSVDGASYEAFFWSTAQVDVTAMILQIEPFYVKGDSTLSGYWSWRMRRMRSDRAQYWMTDPVSGGSREVTTVVSGSIRSQAVDYGDGGAAGERILVPTPGATKYGVGSATKAELIAFGDLADGIYNTVGNYLGSLSGEGTLPIEMVVDRYLTPTESWTAAALPTSALKTAYRNAALKWPSSSTIRAAFDLTATSPTAGSYGKITLAEIPTLADDAVISIFAYSPNRKPLLTGLTDAKLKDALKLVVNRNLTKKINQGTIDDYGLPAGYDPNKYYAFPTFFAPTDPAVPGECRAWADEFPLVGGIIVSHLVPWNKSSFNGCKTKAVYDLTSFNANIPLTQGFQGSACWLNWRIIRIPEPKFVWSDELKAFMPQASFLPTAVGSVNNEITIKAHRKTTGEVSYRSGGLEYALPWSEDKQSNAVMKLPTYLNFTQVGISAEVGVPGKGGQVLARVGRTTVGAAEYDLKLTFARTALEQLQSKDCRSKSAPDLLTYCGIAYDTTAKEWYYKVHLRTWYGAVYYAPGAPMNDPKLRGLFNLQHTVMLPAKLTQAVPDRIRDYTWTTPYQDSYMRFPTNSPRFELTGGYWTEMRNLAAGLAADGGPSDPSRPAYTYNRGSYYPIIDATGFGSCAPGFADGSRCYVNVYVRSRQPVTDR